MRNQSLILDFGLSSNLLLGKELIDAKPALEVYRLTGGKVFVRSCPLCRACFQMLHILVVVKMINLLFHISQ